MLAIDIVLLIIIGVLLFELIIFIHEFGHFITAKKSGVKVNEFALGMGPKLIKFQKGETLYSLRLFPIGGFCAMEGEDEDSDDKRAFNNAKVWKRMIIVVAGVVMNILLGFVLMFIYLLPSTNFVSSKIAVFADSAVSSEYLQVGDEIKSINGFSIHTGQDLNFAFAMANPDGMNMVVIRNGEKINLDGVKFAKTTSSDGKTAIRLDFKVYPIEKNFGTLLEQSFWGVVSTVKIVWASLIGLIQGKFGFNEIAGPIGMTSAISQVTAAGLESSGFGQAVLNLVYVMMMITVNLGVMNLLPLPALDGGRLVFLIIEAIRRKPISRKYEGYIHAIGLVVLLLFMAVVSFSDILRLFTGTGLGG
ncbi:MAG: M50 family metallopeptidase [Acutalibacteraceae bacterium]